MNVSWVWRCWVFAPMSRSFIETSSVYYSNSIWFSLYHRWHTGRIFTAWFKWPNSDLFFFSPMWHRSHMVHDHVSRKKSHGFQYSPIGFRPHLYVEINQIWIGYMHLRLPCKRSDRIFSYKCDSYIIEKCFHFEQSRCVLVTAVVSDGLWADERFSPIRSIETTK